MIIISNAEELDNNLRDTSILPGTILELSAGTYQGDFVCSLNGTEAAPIIVKPHNQDVVIISGSLDVNGTWTHFYDIDFVDSRLPRTYSDSYGISSDYEGVGFYGCSIHDMLSSGINWYGSGKGAVEECVFYNNLGYAIYTHNNNGGLRSIARNVFHAQVEGYSLHIYSGGANYLKDYQCRDNILSKTTIITGGGLGLIDFVFDNNVFFSAVAYLGRDSGDNDNINGVISNNKWTGTESPPCSYYTVNVNTTNPWVNLTEEGNIFYGDAYPFTFTPQDASGYSLVATPATKVWITPFTKSHRWVGSVAIYNRDSADTVSVDFDSILPHGDCKLWNAQNLMESWDFHHEIGTNVNVPMTDWTHAQRLFGTTPANSYPIFGVFMIEHYESQSSHSGGMISWKRRNRSGKRNMYHLFRG